MEGKGRVKEKCRDRKREEKKMKGRELKGERR